MKNNKGSKAKWQNNKKSNQKKGSDGQSSENIGKYQLKFAFVSKSANFAPYDVVKDAFILVIQALELKAKALMVKCLQEEKHPDFRAMKPEREKVSWDIPNNRLRTETMSLYQLRVTTENSTRTTRQQAAAGAQAQQEPELSADIKELVKDFQADKDAEFEMKKKQVMESEQHYNNDIYTVQAELKKFTSLAMQKRIEQMSDYMTRLHNNPIEYLKEIKLQINDNTYSIHPAISAANAIERMLSMVQEPEQSVADYHKAFKARRDVVAAQAGNIWAEYVKIQLKDKLDLIDRDSSKSDQQKKAEKALMTLKGRDEIYAILFIENADKSKYGSLQRRLKGEHGQEKKEVYPATLDIAVKTLNTHTWDAQYWENKKKAKALAKERQKRDNNNDPAATQLSSFGQNKKPVICFICGKTDHIKPHCPLADSIPKKDWYITKQHNKQSHMQQSEDSQQQPSDGSGQQQGNPDQSQGNANQDQQQSGTQIQCQHTQRVAFRPRRGVTGFRFNGMQKPLQTKKCLFQTTHQLETPMIEKELKPKMDCESLTTTLPLKQCHCMAEGDLDDDDVCYLDSGSAIKGTWKTKML